MEELIEPLKTEEMKGGHLKTVADSGKIKKVVFILVGHYLPGFKGGGPTRSISNLVSALGKEFTFKVTTLDRDTWVPGSPEDDRASAFHGSERGALLE
jgi:hypothetical protein